VEELSIEVLVPDFRGKRESVAAVIEAGPDIFAHNLETVPRLYHRARGGSSYNRSLEVLRAAKELEGRILTKSGLMVGLGETRGELYDVLRALRATNCDIVTIGQYLRPSLAHLPVERYVPPGEFDEYAAYARDIGFRYAACGPLVRSSYRAHESLELKGGNGSHENQYHRQAL
jgi:lipoic acid synthetase